MFFITLIQTSLILATGWAVCYEEAYLWVPLWKYQASWMMQLTLMGKWQCSAQINVSHATAHLISCVSHAAQTCTLSIDDVEKTYFYSLEPSDGDCSQYKDAEAGVFTWNAGDSCNFKCAEGYYSANPNGNAIPFQCSADLNRTSPLGLQTTLTPCESTCFEKQLIMSVTKRNIAMRLRGILRTHFGFQYRAMHCNP